MAESQALISTGITVTFPGLSAELVDINKDPDTNDIADVSHQESPDLYREFKPGLTDAGVLNLTSNFIGAAGLDPQVKGQLVLSIPTETTPITMTVTAIVQAFDALDGPLGDKIASEIAFKLSGKPVWAQA